MILTHKKVEKKAIKNTQPELIWNNFKEVSTFVSTQVAKFRINIYCLSCSSGCYCWIFWFTFKKVKNSMKKTSYSFFSLICKNRFGNLFNYWEEIWQFFIFLLIYIFFLLYLCVCALLLSLLSFWQFLRFHQTSIEVAYH